MGGLLDDLHLEGNGLMGMKMEMKSLYICLLHILLLNVESSVQDDLAGLIADLSSIPALKSETYLFVGEKLTVTCTLDEETIRDNWTTRDIVFRFVQPKKANSKVVCVDNSKVQVIDQFTAQLIIRNVTPSEAGVYYCYVSHDGCSVSHDGFTDSPGRSFIGNTDDIAIQYKPQTVTDFKCVIYNWDDHMKCTWTHPVPYGVEYGGYSDTFVVIKEGDLGYVTYCPRNDSVSCLWPKDRLIQKDNYLITVEVWNAKKGIHTSQVFDVRADEIVKPAPVRDVKVKTLPNQCFELSWTHGSYYEKVYRITQQKYGDPKPKVVIDDAVHTSYQICDYSPFSVYTFTVDCHPRGLKGYWSDPQEVHVLTSSKKAGPVIVKGSYNTAPCMEGLRNVTWNWRKVDRLHRKGIVDSYSVKLNGQELARMPPSKQKRLEVSNTCVNAVVNTASRW